jgi:hypothetical protein
MGEAPWMERERVSKINNYKQINATKAIANKI